jgi:hypothetical protein
MRVSAQAAADLICQRDIQHPIYAPLHGQWESFIQQLINQKTRRFMVKTANDQLASIWSLKMKTSKLACSIL